MQLLLLLACSSLSAALLQSSKDRGVWWTPDSTDGTDKLYLQGHWKLALDGPSDFKGLASGSCNLVTAKKRREWHTLSKNDRKAYISAVKCLMEKPSRIGSAAPGAKSRYDDFVAHIQNTLSIHGTGDFLSWHRYFLWAYENALQNECGYKDNHPYLNWGKLASSPLKSPLFDGTDTSIGGDGAYKEHAGAQIPSPAVPFINLPPGSGGDCITSGPFKDMEAPTLGVYAVTSIRSSLQQLYTIRTRPTFAKSADILSFQNTLQGDFPSGLIGVHIAGHFVVGGDPGGDLFASPGDPYFFLHHGQINRTWWIWQNQDLAKRERALAGTLTLFNSPPSRDTALTDEIDLGVLAPTVQIGDVMSTTKGALCYIYV
ncbi:Tyrosinase [Elsinoe australis]|uniref:Tyrosinase n=1 Tax=Elsinoe australis TaxID=40998 RepID=A0A2P7Z1M8_9PEZI|nr:Tyrosinase [Elsinoe australis]